MALKSPYCQLVISMTDPAHVDAARRAVIREAVQLNATEQLLSRLAVVVQEMARNLILHAGQGDLLFGYDETRLDLLAVDRGPGMANVSQCMADCYSTAGTMGTGLGAIKRMSDDFDLYSQLGSGTVVYASFALAKPDSGSLQVGAISTPYPGEDSCGDAWAVKGNRVMICDGLGHGHAAHAASSAARELFLQHDAELTLESLIERSHRALQGTRGGALAFAELQPEQGRAVFCGVGNIAGVLWSDRPRSMVAANGTVGYVVGPVQSFSYPWDPSMYLVMSSDGITSKVDLAPYRGIHSRHPAVIAALIHRDFRRPNDDATVVVARYGR